LQYQETTYDNSRADAHRIAAPAMLIIGEVAALGVSKSVSKPQSLAIHDKPESKIQQKG
jgi:hypothetical protein